MDLDYRTFAPIVFLHPKEETMPTSAEFFLQHACMKTPEGTFLGGNLLHNRDAWETFGGNISSFILTSAGEEEFCKIKNGTLVDWEPPVYVNLSIPPTERFKYFQYWFFYPYNSAVAKKPFKKIGRHEGDWEHVTVEVSIYNGNVNRVFMSAHGSRESRWYDKHELEFTNRQVHVYSAKNSHANYPRAGQWYRGPVIFGHHCKWLGLRIFDDYTEKNEHLVWNTSRNAFIMPEYTDKHAKQEYPWLWFGGRWGGKEHSGTDKTGPRSPFFTESYKGD